MAIERKKKQCKGECGEMQYLFSKGLCKSCWSRLHKKPIKPISDSLKEANKIYKIEKAKYMKEHPMCEAGIICKHKIESQDVHHKDENPLNNSLDNLQRLCRSCHIKVHRAKTCTIQNCNQKHKGYGYCDKHYQRLKKYGNPLQMTPKGRLESVS